MIRMIKDEWQNWVYMLLAVAIVMWISLLFGCAGSEPESPITMYRVMYGFEPARYRVVFDENQKLEK